jgi:DNA-binding transcriptional LysR family regulator
MVASLGSFNQAADMLDYAQSTVSEQIKALESELDVKLFNRDGKHISLTTAGELFLRYAQKMIDLEEEMQTKIKESGKVLGSLSIRIPETVSTYFLPPVLKKFQKLYPHVNFQFNSCSTHGLYEELRSGIINLAFLITTEFRNVDLETRTLMEVPLVLVTCPGSPLAVKSGVQIKELADTPVFATSSDCNYFKILEKLFMDEQIKFSSLYRINSVEAIKQNIIAGTGIALLPRVAVYEEISLGLLVELPVEKGPFGANLVMIWLKNKWHPPILEAFISIIKETLVAGQTRM